MLRAAGLVVSLVYAGVIVWVYSAQPQTMAEVTGGLAAGIGAYRIDEPSMPAARPIFRKDQFDEAGPACNRADPAQRDARTQFYIAYSYYRQGWGRVYHDDELFKRGLERIDRAIAAAPGNRIVVDDANLGMRSADELKAELERGLRHEAEDFNPLKLFRERK